MALESSFSILVAMVLAQNFVLVKFLGLCPFVGASQRFDHALGLASATGFVLTLAAGLAYLIERYLLAPLDAGFLRTLAFIVAIGVAVQATELVLRAREPRLHRVLGVYLPLITTNCAVLGVALLQTRSAQSLIEALWHGLAAALGFALVLLMMAGLRERLRDAAIPGALAGAPIVLVSAGLMALGFLGFAGFGSS